MRNNARAAPSPNRFFCFLFITEQENAVNEETLSLLPQVVRQFSAATKKQPTVSLPPTWSVALRTHKPCGNQCRSHTRGSSVGKCQDRTCGSDPCARSRFGYATDTNKRTGQRHVKHNVFLKQGRTTEARSTKKHDMRNGKQRRRKMQSRTNQLRDPAPNLWGRVHQVA
jgi:hypothetical protein